MLPNLLIVPTQPHLLELLLETGDLALEALDLRLESVDLAVLLRDGLEQLRVLLLQGLPGVCRNVDKFAK